MVYIIIVNYNNTHFSIECLNSIKAMGLDYFFYVVDNNSKKEEKEKLKQLEYNEKVELIYLDQNVGYFPALDHGYQKVRQKLNGNDYVVIGNNDLSFSHDFFDKMLAKNYTESTYVICPDIVNCDENHQNPAITTKYSKMQLLYLDLYHAHYIFALAINYISRFFKFRGSQKSKEGWQEPGFISIGYGACFILTRNYWEHIPEIPNYLFLMNEENALSDIVFKHGGRIYYDPELVVNHLEHSSVVKLPSRKKYMIEQESYRESKRHFDNSKLYDKMLVE